MTAIVSSQTMTSPFSAVLPALLGQLRALRQRRARRHQVATLLEMDPARLDDLGLSLADVRDALHSSAPTGQRLHARRANAARNWSPKTAH